jgi:hypothetical protein
MSSSVKGRLTATTAGAQSSARVARREIVSAPGDTIQVERITISKAQESLMTSALREGRKAAGKSESK